MNWAFAAVERVTGIDRPRQLTAYFVALGHGGTHWIMGALYIMVPFVREDLGLSYAEAGAIFSVMAISSFVVNIGSGAIVDLTGRRVLVLGIALAGCALAMLGIGLMPSVIGLTIGVAVIGGANNLWHPAAFSFLSGRFPNNRGFAISVHGMGSNIGDALGPLVAGAVMGWIGWQSAAIANGLPMLVFAAVIVIFMGRDERRHAAESAKPLDIGRYFRGILALVKQRAVLGICLLGGLRTMTQNGVYIFLPLYLNDVMGIEAALIGVVFAVMQTGGMISGPIAGTWSDHVGRRPIVLAGFTATAGMLLVLTTINHQFLFVAAVACLGFAMFAVRPVVHTWMMDLAPEEMRGGATNLVFGAQAALRMVIPVTGGFMADAWGVGSVFYLLMGIAALGTVTAAMLPNRQAGAS